MGKRRTVVIVGLLAIALAVVAYLTYTSWKASAKDRPTLMYFRANL